MSRIASVLRRLSQISPEVALAATTPVVKITPFQRISSHTGDDASASITVDGVVVGEIVREMMDIARSVPRKFVASAYQVSLWTKLFDGVDADKSFPVDHKAADGAKAALAAAKTYARKMIADAYAR